MGNAGANWKITVGNKTYGNPNLKSNWLTADGGSEPWKNRPDWVAHQVKGSEKGAVAGTWIAAVVTGLMFGFFVWHAHLSLFDRKMGPMLFFFWIFPTISLLFLGKALWETYRLKRFGDPVLELTDVPIRPGSSLDGRITLNSSADNAPEFTLHLACIHRIVTQGSKSDHVSEKVLWSGEKKATLLLGGILPVSIDVPGDQQPCRDLNSRDSILWRLTVTAPFRGVHFLEKYEVPVFEVASSPDAKPGSVPPATST